MALPLRGDSLGNPEDAAAIAISRGGHNPDSIRRYAASLWATCAKLHIRADVAFAQADLETGNTSSGIGFQSARWTNEGNPAGIGITNNKPASEAGETGSPEWWGQVHAAHLAGYAGIDPGEELKAKDFRWQNMIDAEYFGIAETVDGLDQRWAWDPRGSQDYGGKITSRWGIYDFPSMRAYTPDGTGGQAMDVQIVKFVGLSRPVTLPADIEVIIDIVPDRFIGWVRSGQTTTSQTKTTFHDTGAPGQNAISQRNYLHNGPSEGGQRRQVGFNFAVDDHRIIQLTPLNEVTWAAGTPEGNRTSWHVEQCFGPGIDWDRSLRNAIALHAGLIAAKGWQTDTSLVKHQYWYGKWCPGQVLNRGLWPSVVSRVDAAVKAIAGGLTAATISAKDICAATVNLNIRSEPTTSADILYTLPAGQETRIRETDVVTADGYTWWPCQSTTEKGEIIGWVAEKGLDGSPFLVVTDDYVEQPEEPEQPDGGWAYEKPLAIAELAGIIGQPVAPMDLVIPMAHAIAVPTFDRYRVIRDTRRLRDFDGAKDVGPTLAKGQEFDGSVVVISDDHKPMVVTPYWTRVLAEDLEVVSDTPKDIPSAEGS